jgi:hypothetical protein
MAHFFCIYRGGNMDNRTDPPQEGRPFDAAERPRQAEPVTEPGFQSAAAQPSSRESRVTEPAVATDGQLVEAGYGHGV